MLVASLLLVVTLVLLPLPAWAFGPVMHVDLGLDVLGLSSGLSSQIGTIIGTFSREFLQGTLGPDRELAKNLASYERHSHNWARVFSQFERAENDAQRAFFLGSMCHLAADVVAHHYFVPLKMVEAHRARHAAHIYWEMRLDARATRKGRAAAIRVLGINTTEHRKFLRTVVPGNLLGPRFNVAMTELGMRVQGAMAFQTFNNFLDRESRLTLTEADEKDARLLATEAQLSVLRMLQDSPVVGADARGLSTLATATQIRRHLRELVRLHGEPNPKAASVVHESRQWFRNDLLLSVRP
jgi:hypothetical protein